MKVDLWFARNTNNEIVSVLETEENEKYSCPICGSEVIPKAKKSVKVTSHFAHIDRAKCNGESMLHWWFKYKFIESGEKFYIKTDKQYEYICKEYKTEVNFQLSDNVYRPDIVVETECGKEIIFEMANTNKKKVQDYIDKWIELDKIIVEVDIKSLVDNNKIFNALYYKGKCFNFNTRDGGYYKTIGKLKEEMMNNHKYDINFVKKLDWFWNDVQKFKQGSLDISDVSISLSCINKEDQCKIEKIIGTKNCVGFVNEYYKYISKKLLDNILQEYPQIDQFLKLEMDYHINSWAGISYGWYGVSIKPAKEYVLLTNREKEERVKTIEEAKFFINKEIKLLKGE